MLKFCVFFLKKETYLQICLPGLVPRITNLEEFTTDKLTTSGIFAGVIIFPSVADLLPICSPEISI